jgi:hypothetical protein
MKTILFIIFFNLIFITVYSKSDFKEMIITGNYLGKNIYVVNPSQNDTYSVQSIFINGISTFDEIRSNAFEIDLSKFEIGSQITLRLLYDPSIGTPVIFNPHDISSKKQIQFFNISVDKRNAILTWEVEGDNIEQDIELEHYKWDNWTTIAVISPSDVSTFPKFELAFESHSGKNLFRLKYTDYDGYAHYSDNIRYTSRTPAINLLADKVKTTLDFSDITQYEILDMTGNILLYGKDVSVDISELDKGKYLVNFDNKTTEFVKR